MFINWDHYRDWLEDTLVNPEQVFPDSEIPLPKDFSTDSRSIQPGDWFIPLVGENFDGHDFIVTALNQGAAGFLYEPNKFKGQDKLVLSRGVPVENTLAALQGIAQGWRSQLQDLNLIALTGSVGKTTAKNFLGSILETVGHSSATRGNFNNEIGVPLSLLKLAKEDKYAAIEMGARHTGDIKLLVELAQPSVACCLNVGSSHIGEFGGKEALLAAKSEIFFHSPSSATLVTNHDQPELLANAYQTGKELITFGYHEDAHVKILNTPSFKDEKLQFTLSIKGQPLSISMPSFSLATPINAAAACAMSLAAGIEPSHMQQGLANVKTEKGRFRPIKTSGMLLIDDAYNANPESMSSGLETLECFFDNYEKILVLGDMLELGEVSAAAHHEIGKKINNISNLRKLWLVGEEVAALRQGALEAGIPDDMIESFASVDEVLKQELPLSSLAKPLVYVKASWSIGLHKFVAQVEKG